MARATNLGMPRIGPHRELKRAVESYWAGTSDAADLADAGRARRAHGWREQVEAGIDLVPSNDFSLYDQMLDGCCLVGAIPKRFGFDGEIVDVDTYFALARGTERSTSVAPLEMTKWFDTNYHYLVPELGPGHDFRIASHKPVDEFREAHDLGVQTRPVLIGPVTFLLLSKPTVPGFSPLALLPQLIPVYDAVLTALAAAGADWVQMDEPCLATDLTAAAREAVRDGYTALARTGGPRLLVTSYFGGLGDNLQLATDLPVGGLHVDLVRGGGCERHLVDRIRDDMVVSAGVVDGRNVWRNDLRRTLDTLVGLHDRLGDRLWIAPSCSLQHVPHDVDLEDLDPELQGWLAFARQKLGEVATLTRAVNEGPESVADALDASDRAALQRCSSSRIHSTDVRRRVAAMTRGDAARSSPYESRRWAQRRAYELPSLPTTTIGSFPQTSEIRRARDKHGSGELSDEGYRRFCEDEIKRTITAQEALGLDVLVHGEPERNDMVQYFGERLAGFEITRFGWVQSYGTRCVRPPILYGDVRRPAPITVHWLRYAQSLTTRPVKGMLTGPVTILKWSFVRDDQPLVETCRQIALAIRDEVVDLEATGIRMIQVDEPALREGLPLRAADWQDYLSWATECFRLATSGVGDETQIHTHMCYAEFGDIIDAVVELDADVISIEAARSRMVVLEDLRAASYSAEVGPGVYDIHAPHVPSQAEMEELIEQAMRLLPCDRLWVNPDCGLKTRRWDEVTPALRNMVAAARAVRERMA